MTQSTFKHIKISGISTVVPEKEICIYDEAHYYDNNIKKIDRMRKVVGFYKRRVVDKDVTPSDLGIQAAETLLKDMNINKSELDALVYVVQRPDYSAPATAYYIHNKLNLSETCAAFDIRQGCPGWVYGLWISHSMIESGACKKILLIAADTPSANMDLSNRISAPVFGDGGTATLVEYSQDENISYFDIATKSEDYEAIINPASGARLPVLYKKDLPEDFNKPLTTPIMTDLGFETKLVFGQMDGLAVFHFTMNEVPKSIERIMEYSNTTQDDISYLLLHQANKQIVQTIADEVNFPEEKAPYTAFTNFGNNTMCSIPTNINCVLKDELKQNKMKVLCSAFGNGLTVASCVINLENIYLSGIQDYIKPKDHPTREDLIKYWTEKLQSKSLTVK